MIWKAVISTAADNGLLPYAITTGFSMYSSVQETNPTFIRQKIRQENGKQKLVIDEYLHDASMLFDDDGRIYLAYGARHIRIIEFNKDLSGINPNGLQVEVIPGEPQGLLEGTHFYKFNGKYYLTLIWWPEGGIRTQLCFRSDKVSDLAR